MPVLPVTRPKSIAFLPTPTFGIPLGVPGRGPFAGPVAIVLHCIDESMESYDSILCTQYKINRAKPKHASLQYLVGLNGAIHQYVNDGDISWGFSEYMGNFATPYPLANIVWPPLTTTPPTAGFTPDYYVINIGIESGWNYKNHPGSLTNNCDCTTQNTDLNAGGYKSLIHLLAWLSQTYAIAPIRMTFHQSIDLTAEAECNCFNIANLRIDVVDYCEECEVPAEYLPQLPLQFIMGRTTPACVTDIGCEAIEDAAALIARLETPFTGLSCNNGIDIVAGGIKGHAPTFCIDLCDLGAGVPAGTVVSVLGKNSLGCVVSDAADGCLIQVADGIVLARFVGRDSTGCLVADIIRTASGIQGSGTAIDPIRENFDNLPVLVGDVGLVSLVVAGGPAGDGRLVTVDALATELLCDLLPGIQPPVALIGLGATECPVTYTPNQVVASGLAVGDTNCIDLTLVGNLLTAAPKISPTAGNQLTCRVDGLYADIDTCAIGAEIISGTFFNPNPVIHVIGLTSNGCLVFTDLVTAPGGLITGTGVTGSPLTVTETPIIPVDTQTVDMNAVGLANHTISANVKVSADAGNDITIRPDGLFVDVGTAITPLDTNSIDLTLAGSVLSANLRIDPSSGAPVTVTAAGLKIDCCPAGPGGGPNVPITPIDSNTVNLTTSGTDNHTLQADVKISPTPGNDLTAIGNGLYIPQQVGDFELIPPAGPGGGTSLTTIINTPSGTVILLANGSASITNPSPTLPMMVMYRVRWTATITGQPGGYSGPGRIQVRLRQSINGGAQTVEEELQTYLTNGATTEALGSWFSPTFFTVLAPGASETRDWELYYISQVSGANIAAYMTEVVKVGWAMGGF